MQISYRLEKCLAENKLPPLLLFSIIELCLQQSLVRGGG